MPRYEVNVYKVTEQRTLVIEEESAHEAVVQGLAMVRERQGRIVSPPRKRLVGEARVLPNLAPVEVDDSEVPETKEV